MKLVIMQSPPASVTSKIFSSALCSTLSARGIIELILRKGCVNVQIFCYEKHKKFLLEMQERECRPHTEPFCTRL
jgi:hypothetical protein